MTADTLTKSPVLIPQQEPVSYIHKYREEGMKSMKRVSKKGKEERMWSKREEEGKKDKHR